MPPTPPALRSRPPSTRSTPGAVSLCGGRPAPRPRSASERLAPTAWRLALPLLCALYSLGCGAAGFRAEPVALSVQRPSNVAVYFAVSEDGQPVPELGLQNFRLYEDGQPLDSQQAGLALLARDTVVTHHTVLLVDVSGSDAPMRQKLARAAASLVREARLVQNVDVLAFDGSNGLHPIASYERATDPKAPETLEGLAAFQSRDASRDLNGALVAGLDLVSNKLAASPLPVHVGTLIVFTRGPDLAGRVRWEEVQRRLDATRHRVYAIGVAEMTETQLEPIGPSGTAHAQAMEGLEAAFKMTGARTRAVYGSHYLLAYCSPSRMGERTLRVEVTHFGKDGASGSDFFEGRFDSTGFTGECNSQTTPSFVSTVLLDENGAIVAATPSLTAKPAGPATSADAASRAATAGTEPPSGAPSDAAKSDGEKSESAKSDGAEPDDAESTSEDKAAPRRGAKGRVRPARRAPARPPAPPAAKPAPKPAGGDAFEP